MKKSLKNRLTLNRETLRNLASDEMAGAQGGAPTTLFTGCPPVRTYTCITYNTCPTNCGQTYCYGV
jgi:hypothetical protein